MPASDLAAQLSAGAEAAASVLREHGVLLTPLLETPLFPRAASGWLKLESEQLTGSFKVRGAVFALASLPAERRAAGIVAASTGNHARAVAWALRRVPGYANSAARHAIFLPSTVAPVKLRALQAEGAPLVLTAEPDAERVEALARAHAAATGATYVSPYNDAAVCQGQATAGLELAQQLAAELRWPRGGGCGAAAAAAAASAPLVVFVPVGGGGLATGVAAAAKAAWAQRTVGRSRCLVVGVQPESNCCVAASVAAGRLLPGGEFPDGPTLSDGTAGGVEPGALTFDAFRGAATGAAGVRAALAALRAAAAAAAAAGGEGQPPPPQSGSLVDAVALVSEAAIRAAVVAVLDEHHRVVEGAAGAAVAAAAELHADGSLDGCHVVVLVCGGNVATDQLRELLLRGGGP